MLFITKTICSTVELRLQTSLSKSDAALRFEQYLPEKRTYLLRVVKLFSKQNLYRILKMAL